MVRFPGGSVEIPVVGYIMGEPYLAAPNPRYTSDYYDIFTVLIRDGNPYYILKY
jgi:hypothetical protein